MTGTDNRLAILRCSTADIAEVALVVGDPTRATALASRLDDSRQVGASREYHTFAGSVNGRPVTVCSHGVGAGGANVCFFELLNGGARVFIRAGTCGGLQPGIRDGHLVLATGAIREDGASEPLIPLAYPAACDRHLSSALAAAATDLRATCHEGLVVTSANFYSGWQPPPWRKYTPHGALAVEMELASLLVVAAMHGARAAGILTVDGNLVEENDPLMTDYDPDRQIVRDGVSAMLDVVVEAVRALPEAVFANPLRAPNS